ncbi:MAG: hypothetical protein AMJ91_03865 [candidate division Zixibacteria bacterium SM23_73_3]|nr:MAG: hypothetical protein AMJ91_03865 [candidate division Zixibacteria bacterium SM23_73_3]
MRIRVVVVGVGLLMFILFSVNCSQAIDRPKLDPKDNIHSMTCPGEHPWQHDDSPGDGGSSDNTLVYVVTLPVFSSIKTIQLIWTPQGIGSADKGSADKRF